MDRTIHNPNLLVWHGRLWLIDHGAALYCHHTWKGWEEAARRPYAAARDHVLLPFATALREADEMMSARISPAMLDGILELVPGAWLEDEPGFADAGEVRAAYREYLLSRLEEPRDWVDHLEETRAQAV